MTIRVLLFTCLFILYCAPVAWAQRVLKVDLAKKIADATPAALPQSPAEKRRSSDARDDGLKGRVKSIIESTQEAGRVKRELYQERYYDEDGNRIRTVDYDEGYPKSVVAWGYIDGMRVNRTGNVTYAKGEKPPPRRLVITMSAEDNTRDPGAPRDTRYRMREVRKYDDQDRLIEERDYQNNGELWSRTTYTYEGTARIEQHFSGTGGEMSKTRETLGPGGNVIEQIMYGGDDDPPSKFIMKYEFDPRGNWIVQRTYEETTVRKRRVSKLLWTSYRKIEYYP